MEPASIVLFGATGDLAKRKIYPALYRLFVRGLLPQPFSVFGLGRREWTDEIYREQIKASIERFGRNSTGEQDQAVRDQFLQSFRYQVLDIGREQDYEQLLSRVEAQEQALQMPRKNRLFYLSVGPEHFGTIADRIKSSGLGAADGWKRLVIEKPFGRDLESARALNRKLGESFREDEIYRIDHYLGKPVLEQWKALQQANPVIQSLWNNRSIASVQITASEAVGVEERAGYYDHIGALRDMFQNHMLQLLMMTAVRFTPEDGPDDVRLKKRRVAEALDLLEVEDVEAHVVRGQYAAGSIQGQPVVGYADEPGIAPGSLTETFVAARLYVDNNAWRGVPFYIRTGKRMTAKSTRIVVQFKAPIGAGPEAEDAPNMLVIEIGPGESITMQMNARGDDGVLQAGRFVLYEGGPDAPDAYERLIGDALRGDATYFAHWEEVELSWRWVQPVLEAFEANELPLYAYDAGSNGPAASDALLAADGFRWLLDEAGGEREERRLNTIPLEEEGVRYVSHAHA